MKWLSDLFGARKTVESLLTAADLASSQCDYAQAEKLYQQALEMAEEKKAHGQVAVCSFKLGQVCRLLGKNAVAETHIRRAYQVHEDYEQMEDAARCLIVLGKLYIEQHRLGEAEQLFHYVLRIYQQEHGDDNPRMVEASTLLADCRIKQDSWDEAENLLKRAIKIQEQHFGADRPEVADGLQKLALCYARQNKDAEAEKQFRRALDIYSTCLYDKSQETALSVCSCCHEFARTCLKLNKKQEALDLLLRAASLADQFPGYLAEADLQDELAEAGKTTGSGS